MVDPQLRHVFVVLAYLCLLMLSLRQAAPRASAAFAQQGQVGDTLLRLTAGSAPRARQRFTLTITSPSSGGKLQLLGVVLILAPVSQREAASGAPRVPLAPRREAPGIYEMPVMPLQAGLWSLHLVVQEERGALGGLIPLRVEELPPLPTWFVWRMGLLTLALLVYATWEHNRRGDLDAFPPALDRNN